MRRFSLCLTQSVIVWPKQTLTLLLFLAYSSIFDPHICLIFMYFYHLYTRNEEALTKYSPKWKYHHLGGEYHHQNEAERMSDKFEIFRSNFIFVGLIWHYFERYFKLSIKHYDMNNRKIFARITIIHCDLKHDLPVLVEFQRVQEIFSE